MRRHIWPAQDQHDIVVEDMIKRLHERFPLDLQIECFMFWCETIVWYDGKVCDP